MPSPWPTCCCAGWKPSPPATCRPISLAPSPPCPRTPSHGKHFHYCLSNPPFGKKWEKDQAFVEREAKEKGFEGRFGAGTPRVSDGSMLFVQHLVDKLERPGKGGGRAADRPVRLPAVHWQCRPRRDRDPPLAAENDYIEAIVALPTDIFFRTGIGTYIWLLTNKKPARARARCS